MEVSGPWSSFQQRRPTVKSCLLSSGSQVRSLPGAQVRGLTLADVAGRGARQGAKFLYPARANSPSWAIDDGPTSTSGCGQHAGSGSGGGRSIRQVCTVSSGIWAAEGLARLKPGRPADPGVGGPAVVLLDVGVVLIGREVSRSVGDLLGEPAAMARR